jgi:group II intron reverse transcriptase/maturase
MATNPARHGGRNDAGARARQLRAAVHQGPAAAFLRRHEREAAEATRDRQKLRELLPLLLLRRVADPRNLVVAWRHVCASGKAPGIDRIHSADLSPHELWGLLRALGSAIRQGRYKPMPDHIKLIPKASGRGMRPLAIPTVIDRTVQRAVVQIIQPLLDPLFDTCSFGYRPQRNRHQALTELLRYVESAGRWVWVTDDIKDAFTQVPIRRLLQVFSHHLPTKGLLNLVERISLTTSGKGIRQGGSLSPLLLNLYLDHFLDRVWRKQFPHIPLLRYADDPITLCQTVKEAEDAYRALKETLQAAGMPLKGSANTAIHDLREGGPTAVNWLGFKLTKEGDKLRIGITQKAWEKLVENLAKCHTKPNSAQRAAETVFAWIAQQAPALDPANTQEICTKITEAAHTQALEELLSPVELQKRCTKAYERWTRNVKDIDCAWVRSRGSASKNEKAASGRVGGAGARLAPPAPFALQVEFALHVAGFCATGESRGRGGWAYLLDQGAGQPQQREGASPFTTQDRMELLAVLRGLEGLPRGTRVRVVTSNRSLAQGMATLLEVRETNVDAGETNGNGCTGNPELWERLRQYAQQLQLAITLVPEEGGTAELDACRQRARQAADSSGQEAPTPRTVTC